MVTDQLKYINQLEKIASESEAVNHRFLDFNFKDASHALKLFAFQYSWYSRNFVDYLKLLMQNLDDDENSILEENIEEEMGLVDEEKFQEYGIEPSLVKNVRHTELFRIFQEKIGVEMNLLEDENLFCNEVKNWTREMFKICGKNAPLGLGALSLGTEGIVKPIYKKILDAIKTHTNLKLEDYIFFPLHIYFDDDHAESLKKIAIKFADSEQGRQDLKNGMEEALRLRTQFFDALTKKMESTEELYNSQAVNWNREIGCLSDLTARAPMFKNLQVNGQKILDLGCGEGYCARILSKKGAVVTGVDISEKMIELAKSHDDDIRYFDGDVLNFDFGKNWDMITAVFLFNYLTIQESYLVIQKCFRALKEGGILLFSVPHPCFSQMIEPNEVFYFNVKNYFNDRDKLHEGIITKLDNKQKLNVRNVHKTIQDYFEMLDGFRLKKLREFGISEELLCQFNFLSPIKHAPLHIEFELIKETRYPMDLNLNRISYENLNAEVLKMVFEKNGCVLIDNCPIEKEFLVSLSKIFGKISSQRGEVYEVFDRKLDLNKKNVLLSATNQSSGFHTDGSSKDYFPRIVGLMCVNQSKIGGETKLSNAYNAFIEMKKKYPHLVKILSEPIKRSLITTGFGEQHTSEDQEMDNEYPVFACEPFKFRYMRKWIEMAYENMNIEISPEVTEAMDKLDKILEENHMSFKLEPGQVILIENGLIAHDRNAYLDESELSKRILWRIWID